MDEETKEVENVEEIDLDKLIKPKHNWIKRGIVMSCENAGHPSHRVFIQE